MAYESGKLTGKGQSRIQRQALAYYMFSKKRDKADKDYEMEKILHHILFATDKQVHEAAYPRPEVSDPDVVPGHTYGLEDLEELEKRFLEMAGPVKRTQSSLENPEWTDWR